MAAIDLSEAKKIFPEVPTQRLSVLVLYDIFSVHVQTTREYLESFRLNSTHNVHYAWATHNASCLFDIAAFDVIMIHYSVRLYSTDLMSPAFAKVLPQFSGLKVLIIQDEYDITEQARTWIEQLGIDVVLTCVPPEYVDSVYPQSRFPKVCFAHTLTGFFPITLKDPDAIKPLAERKIDIGYRGRPLPFYYGDLGREKLVIGQKMRQLCEGRDIAVDIDWSEESRIYGGKWYEFLEDCRATLGTESGSNVFDDHGYIRIAVKKALKDQPSLTYEEIHERYLAEYDGKVKMNQISPRIFEAIAHKTGLILFEGNYSGVVKPDVHYIALKKDFSNLEEVLAKLKDDSFMVEMIERVYRDIALSPEYTYGRFVENVDRLLAAKYAELGKSRSEVLRYLNKSIVVTPQTIVDPDFSQYHWRQLEEALFDDHPRRALLYLAKVIAKKITQIQFPGRYYLARAYHRTRALVMKREES